MLAVVICCYNLHKLVIPYDDTVGVEVAVIRVERVPYLHLRPWNIDSNVKKSIKVQTSRTHYRLVNKAQDSVSKTGNKSQSAGVYEDGNCDHIL